jgi:hypothetical protein
MRLKILLLGGILLWQISSLQAQLCPGGLGDPIVNITFGSGPNPGPPLSAATTNYRYNATQCPNDGFYAVVNQTNASIMHRVGVVMTWHLMISRSDLVALW